ncbi:MAG: hypothetical protein OQK82_09420 [Candidatus Pacearchaeota archaeon]|nr:hypothetical protein [Candidatus Pacearchaeota archaeon]
MSQQRDPLSMQIYGFHLLKDIEEVEGQVRVAQATITDQAELDIFLELDRLGAAESRFIDSTDNLVAFDDMTLGQVSITPVPVLFHPPYSESSPFAWSLDDLLKSGAHRIEPPTDFFIAELNYRKGEENVPNEVDNYFQVTRLAKLLRDVADHTPGKDQVIFLGASKFEMIISYGAKDLHPLEGLDCLDAEIREPDHHHSQRLEVFRNTLIDILTSVPAKNRTQHLISHFGEFVDRYRRDFQLYAKDFTAKRQIEDISKKQLELAEKIDAILTSIQNRLLAVPITLVLAAGQFSTDVTATTKNLLILIGWLIFAAFVWMMVGNQSSTLTGLGNEIGRLKSSSRELDVFDEVADRFTNLESSQKRQRIILIVVWVITALTTLLIAWLFIQFTYPEIPAMLIKGV